MEDKDKRDLRDILLQVIESSLEAQLRVVRRLRSGAPETDASPRRKGMSNVDIAEDILRRAGKALHVNEIIERAQRSHSVNIDRESLVSALSKKIERGDRFERTGPNIFALRGQR